MSYAISGALQQAVFETLGADVALGEIVGDAIYDAIPAGALPPVYVSLGPETVRDAGDVTGRGAEHRMTITVITESPGFAQAKTVAGAVCDALHDASLNLSRGRLVSLQFEKASAAKIENASARKIDLIFRARVEDS